jgi:hypothetical protein
MAAPDDAELHRELAHLKQHTGYSPAAMWALEDLTPGMVIVHVLSSAFSPPSRMNRMQTLSQQSSVGDVWKILDVNTGYGDFSWITPENEELTLAAPETMLGPVHRDYIDTRHGPRSFVWCRPSSLVRVLNEVAFIATMGDISR